MFEVSLDEEYPALATVIAKSLVFRTSFFISSSLTVSVARADIVIAEPTVVRVIA